MRRFVPFGLAALAVGGAFVIDCGSRAGLDDSLFEPAPTSPAASAPSLASPHVYFGRTTRVALDADGATSIPIRLLAGARMRVDARSGEGDPIAASVTWLRANGARDVLSYTLAEGADEYVAPSDGTYVLALAAATPRAPVAWVTLGCGRSDGRCAAYLQPGETCLVGRPCDDGLACANLQGSCVTWWEVGTCIVTTPERACPGGTPRGDTSPRIH